MKVSSTAKPGRPKSEEKRWAILVAAADLFLDRGFAHTSMEEVARTSGVSKQTIYSHFKNKDALFTAVIKGKCEQYQLNAIHESEQGLRAVLQAMAKQVLALFHDEEVIAMYSAVIAEAKNTPHVAELFYAAGPQASMQSLARLIHTRSEKPIDEASSYLLAVDFYNMLKGEFHMRSLINLPFALSATEQKDFVNSVVEKSLCLHQHYYQ